MLEYDIIKLKAYHHVALEGHLRSASTMSDYIPPSEELTKIKIALEEAKMHLKALEK